MNNHHKRLCNFLLVCLLLISYSAPSFGQFDPLAYWRFEGNGADASVNGNHPISLNVTNLNFPPIVNPIAGQYHHASHLQGMTPGASNTIDDGGTDEELTLEFWFRSSPGMRVGSVYWNAKCQMEIADDHILWVVDMATANTQRILQINFTGIGASDPHNLLDGQWHHIVGQYSACTGDQRIFIDGLCPPGFSIHQAPGLRLHNGGDFHVSYNGGVNLMDGDLDEMAVYDTLIPPQLIWQHFNQGGPYTFLVLPQFAGPVPYPTPTQQSGANLLEFAPGYPNPPLTPLQLFDQYPMPRYDINDSIRPNIPWMADAQPYRYGSVPSTSHAETSQIFEKLASDWNYYLFCGGDQLGYQYATTPQLGNPNFYMYHVVQSMANTANDSLKRFMVTNWHTVNNQELSSTLRLGNFGLGQSLAANFYIRMGFGLPVQDGFGIFRKNFAMAATLGDPRMDSLAIDGLTVRNRISKLMQLLPPSQRYMDLVGENDEVLGILAPAYVQQDGEIQLDFAGFFPQVFNTYQGARLTTMRERYKEQWQGYLDTLNRNALRPMLDVIWYNMAGQEASYSRERDIVNFRDGLRRGDPYFYPQSPLRWQHGIGATQGMDQIITSAFWQTQSLDSIFIPAISPGLNDGIQYIAADEDMLRPGQFLGILKSMACIGADAYNFFSLQVGANSQANWRIWQMPMASYAQGITSRVQPFLYGGAMLNGDPSNLYHGFLTTMYTFSTGNAQDMVTARQLHSEPRYLITASAQRLSNAPSQAPHTKVVSFNLHDNQGNVVYNPFTISERLQGSTYILDNTNPGTPVFYQLDRWHEWKEPSHWCRDFDFEAEVWDSVSAPAVATIHTERPVGVNAGDFSEFTSFVRLSATGDWLRYDFQPRGADQNTLYFWVRLRNNTGAVQSLSVSLDGGAVQMVPVPAANGWQWVGAPASFTGLGTAKHFIQISVGNIGLDIDQVTLKRSAANFSSQSFAVAATGQDVCLGSPTAFTGAVTQPAGCIELQWDFGDGGRAYDQNASHTYQYPGLYTVIFTAYHGCLDSTVHDTIFVHVNAPVVDAGPDQITCLGGDDVLQGHIMGATNPRWRMDLTLSSTTVLTPTATPTTSHYYYLTADSGGCSMTDSVWVAVVAPLQPVSSGNVTICPGQSTQLQITNAAYVWWNPTNPQTLSNNNAMNPIANPVATTTYHWFATDICHCDTVEGDITVTIDNLPPAAICQNLTVQLDASGNATITTTMVNNGSTDNCGIASIGLSASAFACANVGSNAVTLTVTDNTANTASCAAIVTVVDATPPVAICQNLTVALDASGNVTVTPAQVDNGSSDNCGLGNLILSTSTFSCAHIGANAVVLTVTDASGNTATCGATVTILDNLPPVALCQNATLNLDANGSGTVTVSIVDNGSSDNCAVNSMVLSQNTFLCADIGANNVVLTVTDGAGNTATCTSTVTVQDITAPNAICQNVTAGINGGGIATITTAMVDNGSNDNCAITNISLSQSTFNCTNLGPNIVTLIVRDGSNNAGTCLATITVVDLLPPFAICNNALVQLNAQGVGTLQAAAVGSGSTDNCGTPNLSASPSTFTCANVGNNTVVLVASDAMGNTAACTAAVQVVDLVPPVALCQNVTVQVPASGAATVLPGDVNNGSMDACGISGISLSQTTFSCANAPSQNVILSVTDVNGNISSCAAVVTVSDLTCCAPTVVRLVNPTYADFYAISNNGIITQPFAVYGVAQIVQPTGQPVITVQNATAIMYMGPTARIELGANTFFRIGNGATVRAGCNSMWDGIYLTLPTSKIEVYNSTVMDATNGIVSNAGAMFDVKGSTFLNNMWGIRVNSWSLAHTGTVVGTSFTGAASLQFPPYAGERSMGGIFLNRVTRGITIGSNQPSAGANTFQGMSYGIQSLGSKLTCYKNNFSGMVVRTNFTGSGAGIYARSTLPGQVTSLTVGLPTGTASGQLAQHRNTFTNCVHGVYAETRQNVVIRGNTFTGNSLNGFFGYNLSDPAFTQGNVATSIQVELNTFTDNLTSIYVNKGIDLGATIGRNTITGGATVERTGMMFENLYYPGLVNQPGVYTFNVNNQNSIALRGNGIVARTSERLSYASNTVTITHNGPNAANTNNGIFVQGCDRVRIYDNDLGSNTPTVVPATLVGVRGVFVSISPNTDLRCNRVDNWGRCIVWEGNCNPSTMLQNRMKNAYDGLVLQNNGLIGQQGSSISSGGSSNRPSDNTWVGTMSNSWVSSLNFSIGPSSPFYVRPSATYNPGIGFPQNQPTNNFFRVPFLTIPVQQGYFPYACSLTDGGSGGTGGAVAGIANNRISSGAFIPQNQFFADNWAFTELVRDTSLVGSSNVIASYYATFSPSQLAKLSRSMEHLHKRNLIAAVAWNQSVVPSTAVEQVQQSATGLAILSSDTSFSSFNSLQWAELLAMAYQCPLQDGKGVLLARSMLGQEGTPFWVEDNCQEGAPAKALETSLAEGIKLDFQVWPNPTDQSFRIIALGGNAYDGKYELANAQGIILMCEELNQKGETVVETKSLTAGLYIVRVRTKGNGTWQCKLVVVH